MLEKIVKDAGYRLVRIEDQECLLQCVETLQRQRDNLRSLITERFLGDPALEEHF